MPLARWTGVPPRSVLLGTGSLSSERGRIVWGSQAEPLTPALATRTGCSHAQRASEGGAARGSAGRVGEAVAGTHFLQAGREAPRGSDGVGTLGHESLS